MALHATINSPRSRDQASELRRLKSVADVAPVASMRRCRSLAILGSKGGIGKSIVTLNLAVEFAKRGSRTAILDATGNSGDIALLCGESSYWNLEHVLVGSRCLDQVTINGPRGVQILSGGLQLTDSRRSELRSAGIQESLSEFEGGIDRLIVDTLNFSPIFAGAADAVIVVTTPEPTAIAAAYADQKILASMGITRNWVVINRAESDDQSRLLFERLQQACRSFLGTTLLLAGVIPEDDAVRVSMSQHRPVSDIFADGDAVQAFGAMVERINRSTFASREFGFFETVHSKAEPRSLDRREYLK